jgi:hypothetical protein
MLGPEMHRGDQESLLHNPRHWCAPGVGTVTVVGGIVALGKTPIPGEIPGGGPQPDWLRLIPDLRLLNGSMVPPVVPNIMDIRWMNCPIQVKEPNPVEEPSS